MTIRRLRINLPDEKAYEVRIGTSASDRLGETLRKVNGSRKAVIVADGAVAETFGPKVREQLEGVSYKVRMLTVPPGESSKSLEVAAELYDALAKLGISRDDLIVSLGGGMVGDLAGFVAATWMRGIAFAQVPTTLLAMVDASVGGKNGVNLPSGKNLVGTFAQPVLVCEDTDFLMTLPEREWACGMGEIAKTAVIGPAAFYSWLKDNTADLMEGKIAATQDAIAQSVAFKADVVIHDEHETLGVRECLNYGHTLAHALESVAGYGHYPHGLAVAEGMRFAARLAADVIDTPVEFVLEQDSLLDSLGLAAIPDAYDPDELLKAMLHDKKVRSGKVRFVLPKGQGSWEATTLERERIKVHLEAWAASKQAAAPGPQPSGEGGD